MKNSSHHIKLRVPNQTQQEPSLMTEDNKSNEIKKKHLEKMNDSSRKHLSGEYFDFKNLAIILFDFVPYENKEKMIEGLKELFKPEGTKQPIFSDEPKLDICDMKNEGFLSGGGYYPVGTILNSDINFQPMQGVQKYLPEPFFYIEVGVGQFVDFSYFIFYKAVLKKRFQNCGIKKTFVESGDFVRFEEKKPSGKITRGARSKGPELEPTIRNYIMELEKFLKQYSHGLFLNTKNDENKRLTCPNFKIVSTPKIDFRNFDNWKSQHHRFLRHIGFNFVYSKYSQMLVGYYGSNIFREHSLFEGLVFLASETDFKGEGYMGNGAAEAEIIDDISFLGWELYPLLQVMYWSSYVIELQHPKWEFEVKDLMSKILSNDKSIDQTENSYDITANAYREFNQQYLKENRNIEALKQNSKRYHRIVDSIKQLKSRSSSDNIFQDIIDGGNRFLDKEKEMLNNIKTDYDLLFRYCNNMITMDFNMLNVKLQKSMKWMTIAMLILAILTIIISIIDNYDNLVNAWNALFPKPYS